MMGIGAADSGDVLCGLRHNRCTVMISPGLSQPSPEVFLVYIMSTIHVCEHRVAISLARNMISDVSTKLSEMDHNVRASYPHCDCCNGADDTHALIVSFNHLKQIITFLLTEFQVC